MSQETHNSIEDAINRHLQDQANEPIFSTGWVLITAVSTIEENSSRYVTMTSEGLQYHSIVGLLTLAKDDAATFSAAQTMSQALGMYYDEDDDYDE